MRRIRDTNIWIVYAAILLVGIAYGTSIAVLAIHLKAHGIPKPAMGGLAAAFALGIVAFAMPAGSILARFGAKRTLAVALLGYAACVASFPLFETATSLAVARFFDGAFSVHVWVGAETALLSRANKDDKGLVMSLYAIALALGYVVGPVLAAGLSATGSTGVAFVAAGALAVAAAAVVAAFYTESLHAKTDAGREHEPLAARTAGSHADAAAAHDDAAMSSNDGAATHADGAAAHDNAASATHGTGAHGHRSPTASVLWRTKTSCFATFSYGYFQASVVLFLPLYLIEAKHVPEERTILVTAFFAAGMLLLSTWAGRLGDAHGHLRTMRVLGTIGGLMVASFVFLPSFPAMCVAVFVAGATLASISPVSLALQGVVTPAPDLGRANALYNGAYALGMLLGPPISGALFTRWGGPAMLYHLAALWAAFVAFCTFFAADDPRARRWTVGALRTEAAQAAQAAQATHRTDNRT